MSEQRNPLSGTEQFDYERIARREEEYHEKLKAREHELDHAESELSQSLAREQRLRTVLQLPPFKYALEHALEVQANVRQMRDYDVVSEADCEVIRSALSSAPDGREG